MTEKEKKKYKSLFLADPDEYEEVYQPDLMLSIGAPAVWAWLLSKHFDLFGLIDAGLAIDKTKEIAK